VPVYHGTATPSAYYLGSTTVSKLYFGATQVWPVAAAALLTIARDNGSGDTSSFSGSGTTAIPFVRATGVYLDDVNGLSHYTWTVGGPCTVSVKWDFSDDDDNGYGSSILKNGVRQVIGTNSNQSTVTPGVYRTQINITGSFLATTGDVLRFTSEISYSQFFSNVRISAA
jgi:hypothetical protein